MGNYLGDYASGGTVMIYFNTFTSDDPAASVTMTNLANTDIHIHREDNLTQRNNAAGVTVDIDVDGIAGNHLVKIDLADNTVADFYIPGYDYGVRMEGTTVDAGTVNAFIGHFSIENRYSAGLMARSNIATLASQTSFTLSSGEASADDDAYNGCLAVITDIASKVQKCYGYISDYTGSTRTVTLAADPGIFMVAAGDHVAIVAGAGTGTNLSAIPWNAAWDAEVQSECADALTAYDPPTNAEMEARTIVAANYFDPAADDVTVATSGLDNVLADIFITAMTEAYKAADGTMTLAQFCYEIRQFLTDFSISGTTYTSKKIDSSTTAKTYTLNDATSPTSITEAT